MLLVITIAIELIYRLFPPFSFLNDIHIFTLNSSAVTSPLVTIMYLNHLIAFLYHLLMKVAASCRNV